MKAYKIIFILILTFLTLGCNKKTNSIPIGLSGNFNDNNWKATSTSASIVSDTTGYMGLIIDAEGPGVSWGGYYLNIIDIGMPLTVYKVGVYSLSSNDSIHVSASSIYGSVVFTQGTLTLKVTNKNNVQGTLDCSGPDISLSNCKFNISVN